MELGDAIHDIKRRNGLRGGDLVIIYDDGSVEDGRGHLIGNIFDEC